MFGAELRECGNSQTAAPEFDAQVLDDAGADRHVLHTV
jgi:hypothetical protein